MHACVRQAAGRKQRCTSISGATPLLLVHVRSAHARAAESFGACSSWGTLPQQRRPCRCMRPTCLAPSHLAPQVDLDLGNYERFLDTPPTRDHNIPTRKIYQVRQLLGPLPLRGARGACACTWGGRALAWARALGRPCTPASAGAGASLGPHCGSSQATAAWHMPPLGRVVAQGARAEPWTSMAARCFCRSMLGGRGPARVRVALHAAAAAAGESRSGGSSSDGSGSGSGGRSGAAWQQERE